MWKTHLSKIPANLTWQRAVCIAAILGCASVAAAQRSVFQLPPDNPHSQLKPGPGVDVVRRDCGICHATDYIVTQPHLDADHWAAEVKKMIQVFGAPINDADAKIISEYLGRNYSSSQNAEPKKTETPKR
jgi:cytochrome c5